MVEIVGYLEIVMAVVTSFAGDDPKPATLLVLRLAGFGTAFVVFVFWFKKCLESTAGPTECVAGIVQVVSPSSFNDAAEVLFPFTLQHPSFDIVVKCKYWPTLQQNAGYIYYNVPIDPSDPFSGSPMMRAYLKSHRVCKSSQDSFAGAVTGAVGGALAFGPVEAAALAACGAAGPFCLLFAALAAVAMVVFLALAGAFAAGHIGTSFEAPADEFAGVPITVGTYVTTHGKIIASGFDNGAIAFWFVDESIPAWPGIADWGTESSAPPFDHSLPTERFSEEDEEGNYTDLENVFCRRRASR